MKNTSKKLISFLTGIVLIASFSACGKTEAAPEGSPADKSSDEKVTLNVWHQWSNDTNEYRSLYDKAVAEYMSENQNVTVNTQTLDTEAYKTKISAEFAGEASGIDVFFYQGAGATRKFVEAGKLLPIDDYITDDIKSKLLPGSTSAFEYDGKTYALPTYAWYMALFCNQDLFDKAGAKLPSTYDELLEASKKLAELDGITPITSGARDGWRAAFCYQALALRAVGASTINSVLSGETPFEDEGFKLAAEKEVELFNAGAFGPNPLEAGNDDSNSAFISGKAAMSFMGSWFANQVYTDKTVTIDPSKVVALKIPMITGKGKNTDYCGGFVDSFWVNKATKVPDEAVKFSIYINEAMGKACYENGLGFCGWDTELDESNLNPLFVQIKTLLAESVDGVLAWDTSLDANAATIHNEQAQTLLAPDADIDAFISEHQAAINQ